MTDDLTDIERAAEAATPGPWRAHGPCCGLVCADIGPVLEAFVCADNRENNTAFIALANPTRLLELVGEIRRLRAKDAERLEMEGALRVADAMLESLRGELDELRASPAVRAVSNLAAPGFGSLAALTGGKPK